VAEENPNSIPFGDPPTPEDIVPVSGFVTEPDAATPEPIDEPQPEPRPEREPDPTPAPERDPGPEPKPERDPERVPSPEPEPDIPGEPVPPILAVQVPPRRARTRELWSLVVAAVGWFIPGAGHLVQRRWARALIGFAAVAALALIGLKMRGNVFPPHGTEPFDFLGFIADAGSGIFYFLAKTVEAAGPDVSRAAGDYGTRLIATAGILNLLLVLDAVEIARGEKA
jgi:hypothetical protein